MFCSQTEKEKCKVLKLSFTKMKKTVLQVKMLFQRNAQDYSSAEPKPGYLAECRLEY